MNDKEKTYLKWYNKVGYGSGDIAGNVVYALLSAFVMIFRCSTAISDALSAWWRFSASPPI